jgi:hypothetical protein
VVLSHLRLKKKNFDVGQPATPTTNATAGHRHCGQDGSAQHSNQLTANKRRQVLLVAAKALEKESGGPAATAPDAAIECRRRM